MTIILLDRADDPSRCGFGRMQSKAIENQEVNVFGSSIANLSNPVVFNIKNAFPVSTSIEIYIIKVFCEYI